MVSQGVGCTESKEGEKGGSSVVALENLSATSQSLPAPREKRRTQGGGAHLNILDHVAREELSTQQSVPELGDLQLTH